jgi:hypothetical protein
MQQSTPGSAEPPIITRVSDRRNGASSVARIGASPFMVLLSPAILNEPHSA